MQDSPPTTSQPTEERPLVPCPACGMLNTPGHYFCNECGGNLPPPSEPSPKQEDGTETESDAESEAEASAKRRWTRLGRSPYWYGNLFILILLGLAAGLSILRLSSPDHFHRIADSLWGPGRRIALPLVDTIPGKWIDKVFGIEITPTAEPDSDISPLGTPSATQEPEQTHSVGGAQVVVGGWSHINLRNGPGTEYDVVGKAPPGSHYKATGILVDGSWCRVDYEGQPAWIACYLDEVRLLRLEGVPYVTQWSRE